MSIAEAWPAAGQPFTVADLDLMPDDGHRYELLDGALIVSPRPRIPHQEVATELTSRLRAACPPHLRVIPEPAVQLNSSTEFNPDIVVIRQEHVRDAKLADPPLLIVEIRSPSTALVDQGRKKTAYQAFGVRSYWIIDPDPDRPEITVFELGPAGYAEVGRAVGTRAFRAKEPYDLEIVPADLVAGLFPH
jgi:Uma2 family endonuclease